MAKCWGLPELLCEFPSLPNSSLRVMRKGIDDGFRNLVRQYSDLIDAATAPMQIFLNGLEDAFTNAPWPIIMLLLLVVNT